MVMKQCLWVATSRLLPCSQSGAHKAVINVPTWPSAKNTMTVPIWLSWLGMPHLFDQVRGNHAVDNAEHLANDDGLGGEQKALWKRVAQHPLAHGLLGQDFIDR